jgi:pimeloyl-[acyl-carrier protein] methyl ester esterase
MSLALTLVHGWGMNASCWDSLRATNSRHSLQSLELPGHGRRLNENMPGSLDSLAEQLLEKAPAESIWCGWSLGSQVALRAAIIAPEKIHGLILIAPTPRFVSGHDWSYGMSLESFESFYEAIKANPVSGLKRFSLLMFEGSTEARQKARDYFRKLQESGLPGGKNLVRGLDILSESDLRPHLTKIKQPVYLLAGQKDSVCPISAPRWMNQNFGWPLVEVDDGHAPQLSHPHLVMEIMDKLEQELSLV